MKDWLIYQEIKSLRLSGFLRWTMMIVVFCAVFANFIANEKPLIYKLEGQWSVPIVKDILGLRSGDRIEKEWHELNYDFVIRAPIPYSANYIDTKNSNFKSPFGQQHVKHFFFRHWLGTDGTGHDVLAGLIYGCRIALVIGLLSMLIALALGIPYGLLIGYFGNHGLKCHWVELVVYGVIILFAGAIIAILIQVQGVLNTGLLYFGILMFLLLLSLILKKYVFISRFIKRRRIALPLDHIGMRIIEIFRSIPGLFLLLASLSLMIRPSMFFIAFIIGFLRWPTIARYVRAEVMQVKEKGFIQSATSLGLPKRKIMLRHLLPNALSPVIVTIAFGISSAVLLESVLSFLGLGLSVEQMSWGKLLDQARDKFDAWWLVFFPGMMIFLVIFTFNRLGDQINAVLNPRLKDQL